MHEVIPRSVLFGYFIVRSTFDILTIMTKGIWLIQRCASNPLTRTWHQQTFFFSFAIWKWGRQDIAIDIWMCVYILILVYRVYSLIFSVNIPKDSDNYPKIKKGLHQQTTFYFPFWHLGMGTSKICGCVSIFSLWYIACII